MNYIKYLLLLIFIVGTFSMPVASKAQDVGLVVHVTTAKGTNPVYRVGEIFQFIVRTSKRAYVQCYYASSGQSAAAVFPNNDQPNNRLSPGVAVTIPPDDGSFKIRFARELTFETIDCYATEENIGNWLPEELRVPLQDIPGVSLEQLSARFLTLQSRDKLAKGSITVAIDE